MITRRQFNLMLAACAVSGGVVRADRPLAETQKKHLYPPFEAPQKLTGTALERGEAYGKRNKDSIRDFLEKEIYRVFQGRPWSRPEMLTYASECAEVTQSECPVIAKEFEGIAEGAGMRYEEILLINLHEELRQLSKLPLEGHCTAAAVAPTDSGDGHTYVGQTWDWMVSVAGKSSLAEWHREDGSRVLTYGFPGMPTGAGINSHGIAVTWTSALKGKVALRAGVPSYMLIAHLLAQKDLESAMQEANRSMHAGWFTIVMADQNGNLLNIEGHPEAIAFEKGNGRMARVGFGTREITQTAPGKPVRLKPRGQHMYDLMKQTAGKNDLPTLQRYFADHEFGIAQRKKTPSMTIDMMVFDTKTKTSHFSRGPDFNLDWRKFNFDAD